MKIKTVISNNTIFHPQLFHLPLRLNEASCKFLYVLWFSVEGFGTNTYDFHPKHVHVFSKSRTCFGWKIIVLFWLWFLAFYTLDSSVVLLYGICI